MNIFSFFYTCVIVVSFNLYNLQFIAVEIILRTYKTQTKSESGLYIIKILKILRLKHAVLTESVGCVPVPH